MARVQIRQGEDRTTLQIVVDGVDLSHHVYRDGFGLVQVGEGVDAEWGVRLIFAAEPLDIDLPDAVVAALREGCEVRP